MLEQGTSLTFGEVDDLTDALAGWLYSKGVKVGSTVGIFMEHRTEYALAYIAAHKVRRLYCIHSPQGVCIVDLYNLCHVLYPYTALCTCLSMPCATCVVVSVSFLLSSHDCLL